MNWYWCKILILIFGKHQFDGLINTGFGHLIVNYLPWCYDFGHLRPKQCRIASTGGIWDGWWWPMGYTFICLPTLQTGVLLGRKVWQKNGTRGVLWSITCFTPSYKRLEDATPTTTWACFHVCVRWCFHVFFLWCLSHFRLRTGNTRMSCAQRWCWPLGQANREVLRLGKI